ncbi:MAG: ArsR family transcriptional regulator [Spartobacteria bacterium]|nr:ArsR family transcriptional regulator [Spartobacteria bacterium]
MKTKKQSCTEGFSLAMLERVASVLRMLAHPHRLKIVEFLNDREHAPVHDIAKWIALPQAATSQHLNHMKNVGLLEARRHGKEVWYSIADSRCIGILECIRTKAEGGKGQ